MSGEEALFCGHPNVGLRDVHLRGCFCFRPSSQRLLCHLGDWSPATRHRQWITQ